MGRSLLHQDLASGGRDATYRAMSFVARRGGPRIAGIAGDLVDMTSQRADMLVWLGTQPDVTALAADYLRYCEQWSPIFKD